MKTTSIFIIAVALLAIAPTASAQKKIKEAEKLGENQADAAKLKKALGM